MDLNVHNYTKEELIELLQLSPEPDQIAILTAVESQLETLQHPEAIQFIKDAGDRLIQLLPTPTTQQVFASEIKKGIINPDLKHTVNRMINIDSFYREYVDEINATSDRLTIQLSEPVNNAISMCLYSIEIPQSWYTFSIDKGNVGFLLVYQFDNTTGIPQIDRFTPKFMLGTIPVGNYTNKSLMTTLASIIKSMFVNEFETVTTDISILSCTIQQIAITGCITIELVFSNASISFVQLLWIDETNLHSVMKYATVTNNLGWYLGFRKPITLFKTTDNTTFRCLSESLIDTSGTKYIIMQLDDYKPNRLNQGLITLNTTPETPISIPSYYNTTLPQYNISTTEVNVQASAPRTLTSAQIYTINSISSKRAVVNKRLVNHSISDVFAKIPIKKTTEWGVVQSDGTYATLDNGPGKLMVEFTSTLQLNVREYFGPVNLLGFTLALYDDKGNALGLNGMDWSCTIMVKSVYEY
jgi:hypothetical protein